jgi:hypothetical protein
MGKSQLSELVQTGGVQTLTRFFQSCSSSPETRASHLLRVIFDHIIVSGGDIYKSSHNIS